MADWEIPIKGPLTFIIATMTIITNILLISVFVFRSNRSPTTIILTSLAVSNSAICITQIPEVIYFNMARNYKNSYMKCEWRVTNHVMYVIYNVFRMTSNRLTVLLGLQRLLAVCTPFYYSRICNPKSTSITVTSITMIAMRSFGKRYKGTTNIYHLSEERDFTIWVYHCYFPIIDRCSRGH